MNRQLSEVVTVPQQSSWQAIGFAFLLAVASCAPVAFLLCLFRLLSFFIMPSLFFDLLFIGFPIGAFLGARYFRIAREDFGRSLVVLQGIMMLSIALCLLCKQADYLRATFYDLKIGTLFLQMGVFSAMFLPFFCAYGLSEYVGYQVGRRMLGGRMRAVYAAYLFGAALAYLMVHFSLGLVGITRIMVGSVVLVIAIALVLEPRRYWLWPELIVLTALMIPSSVERRFLEIYKGTYGGRSITSTKGLAASGDWKMMRQQWGRYALCELMESRTGHQVSAFYNDVFQWSYSSPRGISSSSLDALPFLLVPEGGRVVIIGSGGGRQVRWAEQPRFKLKEIVAVELEPEVFEATRRFFPDKFNYVYDLDPQREARGGEGNDPPIVTPVRMEGRTYLAGESGKFDLIFMPSVGGYPQMMLEPGNMIRTFEAYQLMKERLTERGVLAVWYPAGLDPRGILTSQYMDTFRSLNLHTNCYVCYGPIDPSRGSAGGMREVLILSSPVAEQSVLPEEPMNALFAEAGGKFAHSMPRELLPELAPYDRSDPSFKPITDDKPFLGGNVRHILSLETIQRMFGSLVLGVVVLGVAAACALRRAGDPAIVGIPYWSLVLASLLVGANFLVMEHVLVIALFRRSYVFYDALILGAIGFLILTGLGSVLIGDRTRKAAYGVCAIACMGLLLFGNRVPPLATVAMVLPAALALGSFFPSLFDAAQRNPLAVFAMDAIGAALGSVCAFFIPILFGLSRLFVLGAALGLCTVLCLALIMARRRDS